MIDIPVLDTYTIDRKFIDDNDNRCSTTLIEIIVLLSYFSYSIIEYNKKNSVFLNENVLQFL